MFDGARPGVFMRAGVSVVRWFCVIVLVTVVTACGSARTVSRDLPAVLEVDNGSGVDMNIYAVRGGSRNRLGTSTAHTRMWFRIPDRLMFGATPLQFQADPIGGNRLPVTQEIMVEPGDTVVWRIPPYVSAGALPSCPFDGRPGRWGRRVLCGAPS